MAETRKVLAQSNPSGLVLTDVYTVGSGKQTVISTITVCNLVTTVDTFRISIAPGGAGDALSQYIYRDVNILGTDTFAATIGITLNVGDVVRFYSSGGNLSISLFGVEIS